MKKLLLLLIAPVFFSLGYAEAEQPAAPPASLKNQAQAATQALKARDVEGILKYTHPKLIAAMGGDQAAQQAIAALLSSLEVQGFTISSITVGEPEPVKPVGEVLTALVPQTAVMEYQNKIITVDSYLLGVSEDDGANWVFIDLSNLPPPQFAALFPDLAQGVELPPAQQPKVVEKPQQQ